MGLERSFGRVAAWAARNSRWVLAVSFVLAVGAAIGATRIRTDAGVGTLVDHDDPTYQATQRLRERFGEEPVVVLVKGELPQLILTENILRLLRLEGCLSGRVPKGAKPIPGPCAELAEMEPVEFVSGPATFLNEAVIQIDRQLRRLAEHVSTARFREFLLAVATKYGITSAPSLDNEEFVATVVFDLARARGTPKARLAYLFPNSESAQIVVRLKPGLSGSERERAIRLIEATVNDTTPRRACAEGGEPAPCFALRGGNYVVSGAPVVIDGVARALRDALLVLLAVALLVMAVTLWLAFRSRFRLLPLGIALAATALSFGLLGSTSGALTMASIGALPILIGLTVDYAIQLQARFDEEEAEGVSRVEAARQAAIAGGPTIAAACLATIAGFLALQLSPIPMIRSFGWLLVAGVAIAFLLSLTAGLAMLSRRAGARGGGPGATHPLERLVSPAVDRPGLVLGVAALLAVVGWAVGTQVDTVSEIRSLAPQSLSAVKDLNELQDTTGVSGELDVSVEADDLTDPAVVEWMADFKRRVLRSNGLKGENPSCLDTEICPGPALSDFLVRGGEAPSAKRIDATLGALSPYALRQVAPVDPRTGEVGHAALISFGIRAQSLEDQEKLVERVRREIGSPGEPGGPPPGVDVQLAGLSVIAAESASALSDSRYWVTLAALLLVALALLAVYRSVKRALVPMVPTVLATGWASLALWVSGVPLNPMSAGLGALTIAVATEFGVILAGRFYEERSGLTPVEALHRAYSRTGAAVLASGLTAVAGFAVLVTSDIQMLRDFGLVTVIDLAAALAGVLVVLPAALLWLEER